MTPSITVRRRDRETSSQEGEEQTDTSQQTGQTSHETGQTSQETGQTSHETDQTSQEAGQTSRETSQTGRESSQSLPTWSNSSEGGASHGASGTDRPSGQATFNVQFSMGTPWWFMMRDQQASPHTQRSPLVMGL